MRKVETEADEVMRVTDRAIELLRTVYDPEILVNVYDLGLIYKIDYDPPTKTLQVDMTLTAPGCPAADFIMEDVRQKLMSVEGPEKVDLRLVFEPVWTQDMMSEEAKLEPLVSCDTPPMTNKGIQVKKTYFLSDLHLGAPYFPDSHDAERRVVAFLDSIKDKADAIYLLGGVLDYWYEYRYVVPRGFVRFFGKLAELSDSGVKIVWMIGNHDIWIFDYLPNEPWHTGGRWCACRENPRKDRVHDPRRRGRQIAA